MIGRWKGIASSPVNLSHTFSETHRCHGWSPVPCTLADELDNAIEEAFNEDNPEMRCHHKREINRGSEEYGEVSILPCAKNSPAFSGWAGLQTIGVIYRSREINGVLEESSETFITSLPCKVRDISKRIRQHWGCEDSQYHVLDVTFTEDASRIRKGTGPEISSVFRRLALSILQQNTNMKDSIRGKRKRCGWDNSTLERLVACFQRG
ncbi:MAG: ISAs1 family transposase [Pirellula sp.]